MPLTKGFSRKTFEEIKGEIEQSLINSLGAINLLAPSVFGNIVAIFVDREAQLWEQLEAVYNASHPQTPEGYSLDGIVALNGIARGCATFSKAICQLNAVPYTKIPKNSMVKVQNASYLFALDHDATITNEKCQAVLVQIKNNSNPSYELTINGELLSFDKVDNESVEDIAEALSSIVNEANLGINATCDGSEINITAIDFKDEFSCFVSDGIALLECTNNAQMTATEKGAIAAPVNSLNIIHTPISGWIGCNNLSAAKIGNNLESDQDLRARREQSIKLGGSGTLEAIRANLLNLNTVTSVSIAENTTTKINDAGLPPHSFEALITGGDEVDIARIIWQKKPAGIRTHGKLSIVTFDSQNSEQVVKFSRPITSFVFAKITITKTKDFVEAAVTSIKAKLISQINSLGVGSSVILKSLYLAIFCEAGIAGASIELGNSVQEEDVPILSESDIAIKSNEVALTDALKIEIILEDF